MRCGDVTLTNDTWFLDPAVRLGYGAPSTFPPLWQAAPRLQPLHELGHINVPTLLRVPCGTHGLDSSSTVVERLHRLTLGAEASIGVGDVLEPDNPVPKPR